MAIVKFISSVGAENTVDEASVAAEIMRNDERFTLVSIDGEKQPISCIDATTAVVSASRGIPTNAAMIRGLMLVKETKRWRQLGYKSFGHYLDSDEVPNFGKTKFYELRDLLLTEGDDRFDVLTGYKIPE